VMGDTTLVKRLHLNQTACKRQVDYLLRHSSSLTPSPATVVLVLNSFEYPTIFSTKKGGVISR
jgi:hypothetical protein